MITVNSDDYSLHLFSEEKWEEFRNNIELNNENIDWDKLLSKPKVKKTME